MGVLTTRFAIYSAKDGGDAKQERFCMEPAASVPLLKNQFCRAQNQTGQHCRFRAELGKLKESFFNRNRKL